MGKKQKSLFFTKWAAKFFVVLIILFWVTLAAFGLLQKFDYRLYDLMMGLRPNPDERQELLFVEVDNQSLEAMGPWPWTRDIIANALIRMKELGASESVFDIEYLSPSNMGVNPDAPAQLAADFDQQKQDISDVVSELTNGVSSGSVTKSDLPDISRQMVEDYIYPGLDALYDSVQHSVYRDFDDIFARSLQFFSNAWLTINIADIGITPTEEEKAYVVNRALFKNVEDEKNLIAADGAFYAADQGNLPGFAPAIYPFMRRAKGAGFTNIVLDGDGTRRRVILFNKQGDNGYVGQLVVAPLLKKLDVQKVVRHSRSVELVGAKIPGRTSRTDITIPLDSHGRMNINWLHKEFVDSFRHESILSLAQLDDLENNIVAYLSGLSGYVLTTDDGTPLSYYETVNSLLNDYADIVAYKEHLLSRCEGYDIDGAAIDGGIGEEEYAEYFAARAAFFDGVTQFLSGASYDEITARLEELKDLLTEEQYQTNLSGVNSIFSDLKEQSELYASYITEMRKNYEHAFCIIGNTASSTTDLGNTPFNRAYPNVGTHANVYNTIVNQDFITPIDWQIGALFTIILTLLYVFLTDGKKAWIQNFYGVLLVLLVILVPILLMAFAGIYSPVVTPVLIAFTSFLVVTILHFITSEKDKSFLRSAFSTYLSPTVVDQIVKDPSKLTLGGEEKELTALFSDIRSFSTFSEMVTPTKLVRVLNEYLGAMSDCILAENGTIDKYIGDAIVSFFGAPIDLENHAFASAVAAIRMKQAEKAFNDEHFASGDIPMLLQTRIGLNSGSMVVGNMGTDNKMNYTMMGDNVNLASRLEGVNKIYHSWILCSETTWQIANRGEHNGILVGRPFDRVRVVGKEQPVQLYNILGFKSEMTNTELEMVDVFQGAIDLYLKREFTKAQHLFEEANKVLPDETSLMFADRCKEYLSANLPEDWDGVYQMTTKGHD